MLTSVAQGIIPARGRKKRGKQRQEIGVCPLCDETMRQNTTTRFWKGTPLPLFALTIFVSAFLLFQVQPLIAKSILPWFGGAASVWTTCMLFFQCILLLGYLYAHASTSRLNHKNQGRIHILLLLVSLLSLPILPREILKPSGAEEPTGRILLVLLLTVGLPYFLLSTTSSLMQAWYTTMQRAQGGEANYPFRLYALSNLGSVLGLVTYPFFIEPVLTLKMQVYIWSASYRLFILCAGLIAYKVLKLTARQAKENHEEEGIAEEIPTPPERKEYVQWAFLAMMGSVLLLTVSTHISQNVAAIPFLWVLPLSLYLFSFILCFGSTEWI